jgi:hypothetical protein
MRTEQNIAGVLNWQNREFYKSLTIGLLAFMVTFVLLSRNHVVEKMPPIGD